MKTNTYLMFDGSCAEAMKFYEKTLNGKLQIMRLKDSPVADKSPCGKPEDVLHAYLEFEGGALMASDWMANTPFPGANGFHVTLNVDSTAEAQRLYEALSGNGSIHMPLQKTFWAEAFAMVVDRFGTPWIINGGPQS